MTNNLKIKKYWITTFCLVFFSLFSFAQELSDETIGFDVARVKASLKEHGAKEQNMEYEISKVREIQKLQFAQIKKAEADIVEKTKSSISSNKNTARSSANTDIPQTEKDALLAFYNSTDGPNWRNKTGWNFNNPVIDNFTGQAGGWYGIRLNGGHVSEIILSANNLTGSIPSEIKNLPYLRRLDINANNLSGEIPKEIGDLKVLYNLQINTNKLTGSIPVEIGNMPELLFAYLHSNELTGNIPSEIQGSTKLQILNLAGNKLSGTLPPEIGNLKNLKNFTLQNNQITGNIPSELGNASSLELINFNNNLLFGPIPSSLFKAAKLATISITDNNLTELPPDMGKNTNILFLYLNRNKISSNIPSSFGLSTTFRTIDLSYNFLHGTIPNEISNCQSINALIINNNLLEGNFSVSISGFPSLTLLQISSNKLTGGIPNLTAIPNLKTLMFSNNNFRFIDFINEFSSYKSTKTTFTFSPQSKIGTQETITKKSGNSVDLNMFLNTDNRSHELDTYQWFKNGAEITGAVNKIYTISNLSDSDAGEYTCKSFHTTNPDMSPLVLEREPITLRVTNCPVIEGSITSTADKFHTGGESNFAFQTTATGLSYEWSVTTAEGTPINEIPSNTLGIYTYTFTNAGDYIVKVKVTDSTGCTTEFTKEITVTERYCDNEPVDFSFETTATNLTYTWTATDSTGRVVNRVTDTTGLYTFTPQVSGEYVIELVASSATSCKTLFTKNITIDQCTPYISCTRDNPLSPEIHRLFINMITKLASAPAGTNVNVYAHKEIAAVAPYTTEKTAKIYNFVNNGTAISFSFTENGTDDVYIPKASTGSVTAIDLSKYVDSVTSTIVATSYSNGTTNNSDGHVKNIDFCPKELSCVSHVALVVDESGSLDQSEINKIKKQLKLFVAQQAFTNDDIGSNIHISITGMSDSDDVNKRRKDFIIPTKVTASNVSLFNNWIEKLGKRYGDTIGISQASDFWKSGLDGALSYSMKPNFVIMITDGAQTDDVAGLKETFKKFDNNNTTVTDPKLPHLYVVGIENGVYIDRNSLTGKALPRNEDPNYNPSIGSQNNLTAKTTPFLTKSLQFLLDLSPTEFPVADINQFTVGTYFGHSNFDLLASDETYFSDKLIVGEVVCGTPAVKDSCDDCFSFKPEPGKEYVLSAWVKEESNEQVKTYVNPLIKIKFYNNKEALDIPAHKIDSLSIKGSGDIIDGWQRVVKKFKIPNNTITLGIELENLSPSIPVYFDDIRIHPLQGSVKSFVYDPETFKLMSELDENNYSTFYEYDNEGGLVRVKKETAKGIKTIQETRSGNVIETTNTTP